MSTANVSRYIYIHVCLPTIGIYLWPTLSYISGLCTVVTGVYKGSISDRVHKIPDHKCAIYITGDVTKSPKLCICNEEESKYLIRPLRKRLMALGCKSGPKT